MRFIVSASDRALNSLQAMQITTEIESEAADADPPSGFRNAGSDHIVNIVLRGTGGRPITELAKPAAVCLPLSDEIVEEAGDDPLAVLHYDDEDGWTALGDSEIVTVGDERLLCAETTEFSLFAIGIGEAAPDRRSRRWLQPGVVLGRQRGGAGRGHRGARRERGLRPHSRSVVLLHFLSGPEFISDKFIDHFAEGAPVATPLYATVPSAVSDTTDEAESEQQEETAEAEETAEIEETSSAERRGVIVDSGLVGISHRNDCREDAAILGRFGWLEGDAIEILPDGAGRCPDWLY